MRGIWRTVGHRSGVGLFAVAVAILGGWWAPAFAFAGGCKLGTMAEFPITMSNLRPLLTARINDVDVQFVVDSGAFYSMVSTASAAELKLKTSRAPFGLFVQGVHGNADVSVGTASSFILAGRPLHNIEFLVGGSEVGQGSIGLLGQNFLHLADVEYDLGQGVIRLMQPEDCRKTMLAYWVTKSMPYSVIDLHPEATARLSRTLGRASVNGVDIRVVFDSGAATSVLSLKAAERAGVRSDSPGVVPAGFTHGIGKRLFATYIAPFSSFKVGDEEIKHTRLRIGDLDLPDADMLIGADFFLSHRIYVANSQNKLYFTYNGGPVFNLTGGPHPITAAAADPSAAPVEPAEAAPEEAADFARRGAAFASRREFDQALAALTRACELAPDNADYFEQRGLVYWQTKQADLALADFDQALKLKPNSLSALLARAQLRLQRGDKALATADLDAADTIAPKEADQRYQMGRDYERTDRSAAAIAQFGWWIDAHPDDARLPFALNARCGLRALEGTDLALALKDCNAALKRADKSTPFYAQVLDSRGLVFQRMGDYERSIADFDASLKINPKNAWALYGRGIDKMRKHATADGSADMALATTVAPQIGEEFKRRGIEP